MLGTEITDVQTAKIKELILNIQDEWKLGKEKGNEFLHYIPWVFLTPSVVEKAIKLSTTAIKQTDKTEQKAALFPYIWDQQAFNMQQSSKHCPPVQLIKPKTCSWKTPWLNTPWGYRPYVGKKKVQTQLKEWIEVEEVSNRMRFSVNKALDIEEMEIFKAYLGMWAYTFQQKAFKAKDSLGEAFKNLVRKNIKGDEEQVPTTFEMVESHFSALLKKGKGTYDDYIQFKLQTQGDTALGIPEDPFTAFLEVYRNKDGCNITSVLEKQNSTALAHGSILQDGEKEQTVCHIVKAKAWCKVGATFDYMYVSELDSGATETAQVLRVAEPEEFGAMGSKLTCPL